MFFPILNNIIKRKKHNITVMRPCHEQRISSVYILVVLKVFVASSWGGSHTQTKKAVSSNSRAQLVWTRFTVQMSSERTLEKLPSLCSTCCTWGSQSSQNSLEGAFLIDVRSDFTSTVVTENFAHLLVSVRSCSSICVPPFRLTSQISADSTKAYKFIRFVPQKA